MLPGMAIMRIPGGAARLAWGFAAVALAAGPCAAQGGPAVAVPSAPVPAPLVPTPVFKAGQLYVWCARDKFANPAESEQFFFCMGYIIATVESHLAARQAAGAPPCLPADIYGSKFIDMTVAYLRRHADRLNEPAAPLILQALYEAHPACK